MKGFTVITPGNKVIRFRLYEDDAPVTSRAFGDALPFTRTFMHARVAGQEVWTDKGLQLDIIQENCLVFTVPGEVVLGPVSPTRSMTRDAIGIYYGEGRGLDGANIFAKAFEEDMGLLKELGERIWHHGVLELKFEGM